MLILRVFFLVRHNILSLFARMNNNNFANIINIFEQIKIEFNSYLYKIY